MSGSFGSSRRSKSRSPIDDYAKRSVLAKVPKSELKTLRVAIRRNEIIGEGPKLPLERSIDDPARICSYVHYRKDKHKKPEPPIFGKGIKVNQDFNENRRVFTHEKEHSKKSSARKTRSKSRTISRSRGRSRTRSSSRRRSLSKHRSRSREHKFSSERRRYDDEPRRRSRRSSRQSRSASRSRSPLEYDPRCPMHGERAKKKSLTPLRPGEYRPGHPDLALRNKRPRSRSRSRSYEGRSRSKRSQSKDDRKVASSSRDRSPGPGKDSRSSKRYRSPVRSDKRDHRSKSRSPDRYRRRSRSPYNNRSPLKRTYKGDTSRSPRKRSRSPHYKGSHGEHMHEEYDYYNGWVPGPRIPGGRGGFPLQSFYAPVFHPRGMIPGPLIPPGHMLVPRMALMPPYGSYRPHLPIYNSGAVRQRGPRPSKPATVTSEKEKDGNEEANQVVIDEMKDGTTDTVAENEQEKAAENVVDKNGDTENGSEEK